MYFISSVPTNYNYGNPHFPAMEGDVELPAELVNAYLEAKGFVYVIIENGVVFSLEKNEEAYDAYMAEHPEVNTPTDLERIEAQALYTALMTDTLLEE